MAFERGSWCLGIFLWVWHLQNTTLTIEERVALEVRRKLFITDPDMLIGKHSQCDIGTQAVASDWIRTFQKPVGELVAAENQHNAYFR